MMFLHRSRLLVLSLALFGIVPGISVGDDPLHRQIEAVFAKSQVGPSAPLADDAEFLRRISLDLTGRIPTVNEARTFLQDTSPDKRQKVVEELIQSPAANRHLAKLFDIMLMERRPDKHVKAAEWEAYLLSAIQQNKPFNQLAKEILAADGTDAAKRAPVKFYLDREDLSVNLITRDTARIFFGRDIECAQCHDHPLISDYEQSEYYGLLAFVSRSSLFQPDPKKPAVIAEVAEGTAKFKSVFTGYEGETLPRLPGEAEITEPAFKKGEEYQVKPAKNVRPVPKYSRREKLAELASAGTNAAFNKNIANRLWAVMLGRGLVNPVDLHHSDNPPASPELLDLLAKEFAAMNFDIKRFLKEIALSETYQRSYRLPESLEENIKIARSQLPALEAEQTRHQEQAKSFGPMLESLDAALKTHIEAAKPLKEKAKAIEAQLAAAEKTVNEAKAALEKLQPTLSSKQEVAALLAESALKAALASKNLPSDSSLAKASAAIKAQSEGWSKQLASVQKQIEQQTLAMKAAETLRAELRSQFEPLQSELAKIEVQIQKAEADYNAVREKQKAAIAAADAIGRDIARFKILMDYASASEELAAARASLETLETELTMAQDQSEEAETSQTTSPLTEQQKTLQAELEKRAVALEDARSALEENWTKHFRIAAVEQLSPEQLAWSILEAVGQMEAARTAAVASWYKQHADLKGKELTQEQRVDQAEYIEQVLRKNLGGQVVKFVDLFAANAGQPQHEFFATVEQALFFANGNDVLGWLRPTTGNLTDRLRKISEPKVLAEELYLSILTRMPTPEEIQDVTNYLSERQTERDQAIQEMAWALLTSSEFRFQH